MSPMHGELNFSTKTPHVNLLEQPEDRDDGNIENDQEGLIRVLVYNLPQSSNPIKQI